MAYFEYMGKKSSDLHLKVLNDLSIPSPERAITFEEIQGNNGSYPIDLKYFKDTDLSFPCTIELSTEQNLEYAAQKISEWLHSSNNWTTLFWSGDPDYYYQAIHYEEMNTQHILHQFGKCTIKFKIKPYKKVIAGQEKQTIALGSTITNPTVNVARPIIEMGAISTTVTLVIGTKSFVIPKHNGLIIDSENYSLKYLTGKEMDWTNFNDFIFPTIDPGENKISILNNVATPSMKILPNWEVLV